MTYVVGLSILGIIVAAGVSVGWVYSDCMFAFGSSWLDVLTYTCPVW